MYYAAVEQRQNLCGTGIRRDCGAESQSLVFVPKYPKSLRIYCEDISSIDSERLGQ